MPTFRRWRPIRTVLARVLLVLLALALVLVAVHHHLQPWLVSDELASARSILWLTAHPDDESFFFAPTILNVIGPARAARGGILCLSIGDHEGAGAIRQRELQASCSLLGVGTDRCVALDHPSLPDNPQVEWNAETILEIVKKQVADWDVDAIITFDAFGVSGHANHRALYAGLTQAATARTPLPPVFTVRSTNVLAKYTSVLLLPVAVVQHALDVVISRRRTSLFLSSIAQYRTTRQSFAAHQSQTRWFRTLFVTASRYLWYVQADRM
ncbi:hypothetical protein JCM1841_001118 [Sporobolomyces salmonicolor]